MRILMVAAENGALPGGKVGGIGDVIRDVPAALAAHGHRVGVITPGYQRLSKLPGAVCRHRIPVMFRGQSTSVELFEVHHGEAVAGVTHWVLEHGEFGAGGAGRIYHDDGPDRPFATDASTFALFGAGVCAALLKRCLGKIDVLHLHDWHAAPVALLRRFDPRFAPLRDIPAVFSIHNLALQGIRPLRDDASSLANWFPALDCVPAEIADPRWPDCVNLMRVGIRHSDRVHAVSPSYAAEILGADDPEHGRHGGEGLQADLQEAQVRGRLFGILNGCDYHSRPLARPGQAALLRLIRKTLEGWISAEHAVPSPDFLA